MAFGAEKAFQWIIISSTVQLYITYSEKHDRKLMVLYKTGNQVWKHAKLKGNPLFHGCLSKFAKRAICAYIRYSYDHH